MTILPRAWLLAAGCGVLVRLLLPFENDSLQRLRTN
jgi:hypothetical protein